MGARGTHRGRSAHRRRGRLCPSGPGGEHPAGVPLGLARIPHLVHPPGPGAVAGVGLDGEHLPHRARRRRRERRDNEPAPVGVEVPPRRQRPTRPHHQCAGDDRLGRHPPHPHHSPSPSRPAQPPRTVRRSGRLPHHPDLEEPHQDPPRASPTGPAPETGPCSWSGSSPPCAAANSPGSGWPTSRTTPTGSSYPCPSPKPTRPASTPNSSSSPAPPDPTGAPSPPCTPGSTSPGSPTPRPRCSRA